jgi:hypothetical protein
VIPGEDRVRRQRPTPPAHQADAADLLGPQPEQDLIQNVGRQHAAVSAPSFASCLLHIVFSSTQLPRTDSIQFNSYSMQIHTIHIDRRGSASIYSEHCLLASCRVHYGSDTYLHGFVDYITDRCIFARLGLARSLRISHA